MANSSSSSSSSSSIMDSLFQRTLDDVIKGLRLNLIGESTFVSKSMEEIRKEIRSTDLDTKSTALQKLAYFNSLHGTDMSWAAFHVVEAIGSPRFAHKKIGYLAASQSFNDSTDVMLLITNQLRKDITGGNEYEVSIALECLSRIGNVDLARDLSPEIFVLLSSSKSYVRKKATGAVLRVFSMYPEAVRVCFKRLVENLETFDSQTVSATVGVFCELAAKDPVLYLPLAPEFYRILVDSKNNWVLIKVLKIFARLAPLEHRLAKRVVEPICELMSKTGAKSLMFECVRTIVTSLSEYESAVKLAVVKIQELLMDDDPNLKYLGLQALSIVAPKHSWAVLDSKDVVIKSLSDRDPNIKLASLRLVMALVSEDNLIEICRVLVNYALKSEPGFCNEILGSVLSTCCRNYYEIVLDFDWYASLLGEMSRIPHCQKGEEIENQIVDISMRVKDVRRKVVHVSRDLLIDPALLGNPFIHRILCASAWVSGENVEFSKNPFELVEALLQPRTNLLPPPIRAVYIQSCFKVLIFCLHSYLFPKESVSSSSSYEDLQEVSGGGDLTAHEAPNTYSQDESFNPRVPNQVHEAISVPNGNNMVRSSVSAKTRITHESIVGLFDLFEMALRPLSGIHEVELHDRVRNVLGFIELVKPELIRNPANGEDGFVSEESNAAGIVKLMHGVLFKELGPVSITAQERVPLPDEVNLKSDLSDLDLICGDIQLPSARSFSFTKSDSKDKVSASISNNPTQEHSESSNESTSLLTEHRKRHGLYYLPSEKSEVVVSTDYPPANNPKGNDDPDLDDDAKDLVKLTGPSLVGKKKSSRSKPRPIVVKLDEVNIVPAAAQNPKPNDSTLSGAVRDVLYSNEVTHDASSDRRRGKGKVNSEQPVESKDNSSSRKHKHHAHSKEKTSRSTGNNGEEKVEKAKHKSNNQRHGRHKTRQRSDLPLSVPAQAAPWGVGSGELWNNDSGSSPTSGSVGATSQNEGILVRSRH